MKGVSGVFVCFPEHFRQLLALLLVLEGFNLSEGVKLATRLVAENYCRGQEAVAHISPLEGGVSLLQRMRLYTPTFHVPENRGCSVLPLGIMVKEVESVTYELGSVEVQTAAVSMGLDGTTGGFNLSFAANQTLQIKPSDVMLPAKEDAGYTLQCACPPVVQPLSAADGGTLAAPVSATALAGEGSTQILPTTVTAAVPAQVVQSVPRNVEAESSSKFLAPEIPQEVTAQASEQLTLELKETALRPWGERQGGAADALAVVANGAGPGAKVLPIALPATGQAKAQQNAVVGEADARLGGAVAATAATNADTAAAKSEQLPQTPEGWFWAIVRGLNVAAALKMACMVSNVIFQVSPLPQVRTWSKVCSTGEADAAPFVAVLVGGVQWCYYGIFAWLVTGRDGFLILVHSNVLGAVLGTYYVSAFWKNCVSHCALQDFLKYVKMAFVLALCQLVIMASLSLGWSLLLAGITASCCSVLNSVALLISVPKVIATRNSAAIPGAIVSAGLVSSTCWTCCGITLGDKCILFPNCTFIGVAFLCLFLKLRYPSSKEGDEEAKETNVFQPSGGCAGTGSTD